MIRRIGFLAIVCLAALSFRPAAAGTHPVVSFVVANISDSARSVQQRAFDVMLREAVVRTGCLDYVNPSVRDSLARLHAQHKEPFTIKELRREAGVTYGAYFALDRFGFVVRVGTKITDNNGTVIERSDVDLLQAADTIDGHNPFEEALRRIMGRIAPALAIAADTTCAVHAPQKLPLTLGAVVLHKMEKGFGLFISDNASRIGNLGLARLADTLRMDTNFIVVDVFSRDQMFARMGEFGIQNTAMPTEQEVALLHAVGIPVFLVADIDSADAYRKLHITVYAYATEGTNRPPVAQADRVIEPDLELVYSTINELGYDAARAAGDKGYRR